MCNLSDLVEERGMEKGREEERKTSIRIMLEMLKEMDVSLESAIKRVAEKFEMDLKEVYDITKELEV